MFQSLKAEADVAQSIWHSVSYAFHRVALRILSNDRSQDNNTGLVWQVLSAFRKFSVGRLGQTFAALTLVDVVHRISPSCSHEEVEKLVASLIMSNDLDATLLHALYNPGFTMLRFLGVTSASPVWQETLMKSRLTQRTHALRRFADNGS